MWERNLSNLTARLATGKFKFDKENYELVEETNHNPENKIKDLDLDDDSDICVKEMVIMGIIITRT